MFDYFDYEAQEIIKKAVNISSSLKLDVVGSECLLLAFIDEEIFTKVKTLTFIKNKIEERINDLLIIRRRDKEDELYTNKLVDIVNVAYEISLDEKVDLVLKEHLLYALCAVKKTIVSNIFEELFINNEELLKDIIDIFPYEDKTNYLINLTKKSLSCKLIGRKKEVEKIVRILSKMKKNNPMLIGSEGVGKSAIVEGVAKKYYDEGIPITFYQLDIALIIAGTKYRGDLEERIVQIIDEIKGEDYILFIDEIHNIVGSNTSDASLDIANILKPILSRNEIKIIGATTLDEYYQYIQKDKALSRRFQNVFIDEASKDETYKILKGIKKDYEDYHGVKYPDEVLKEIVNLSTLITTRRYPDKAIDVLDEVAIITKKNNTTIVTKEDIAVSVFEMIGINYQVIKERIKRKLYFPELKKYYLSFIYNFQLYKNILNITYDNDEDLLLIICDLKYLFNIKDEMILNLDLSKYNEQNSLSSLIGTSPGYIGYDNGGVLTEHVNKYPLSIINVSNLDKSNVSVQQLLECVTNKGEIIDGKGRTISFHNSFILVKKTSNKKDIGFIKQSQDRNYITYNKSKSYKKNLIELLNKISTQGFNFELKIEKVDYETYTKVKDMISENLDCKIKNYTIIKDDNMIKILKK